MSIIENVMFHVKRKRHVNHDVFKHEYVKNNDEMTIKMTTKTRSRATKTTIANDVATIDETTSNDVVTNANDTNAMIIVNDETNVANDETTRATTRALNNATLNIDDTKNEQFVIVDDTRIKIVKTSSNAMRIDHSICTHESTKNARSKCRTRIANAK